MLNDPVNALQVTHRQRLWLYAVAAVVLFFLVAPVAIVFPMSFSDSRFLEFPPEAWSLRWYRNFFGSPDWMAATWVSIRVAVGARRLSFQVRHRLCPGSPWERDTITSRLRSAAACAA